MHLSRTAGTALQTTLAAFGLAAAALPPASRGSLLAVPPGDASGADIQGVMRALQAPTARFVEPLKPRDG